MKRNIRRKINDANGVYFVDYTISTRKIDKVIYYDLMQGRQKLITSGAVLEAAYRTIPKLCMRVIFREEKNDPTCMASCNPREGGEALSASGKSARPPTK